MELTGTIVDILPITSGVSKGGKPWKKQEAAIEIPGTYPKTIAFSMFGDKCENHGLTIGQSATIHINIESRKYNERYFTEVSAWKIELNGYLHSGNRPPAQSSAPRQVDPVPEQFAGDDGSDLPF
jgi:hypothetical protein